MKNFLHNKAYSSKILFNSFDVTAQDLKNYFLSFILTYYFNQNKKLENKSFLYFIILIGIFYFLLRYNFFGKLLPNTFYHKSIDGFSIYNFFDIYNFKRSYSLFNYNYLNYTVLSNTKIKIYQILTPFVLVYFFYLNSRLSMNYAERFFIQIFLPLMIFCIFTLIKNKLTYPYNFTLFSTSVIKIMMRFFI